MASRFGRWGRAFRVTYRWRRSALTALAAVAVVALSISQAGSSRAQQSDGEISNGMAKATSWVARIAPAVGNLELALTTGVSVSEVTNDLAQSEATFQNLGLIGTTLTAEQCDGSDPPLRPDQLPQILRVDNRNGDAKKTTEEEYGGAVTGRRTVEALTDPASSAETEIGNVDAAPLLSLTGGHSTAETTALPGEGREARASSVVDVKIGPIELKGMRWDAYHRTGSEYASRGSFSIGSAAGSALVSDTEDLAALEEGVNTALTAAGTGLQVQFPEVRKIKEPTDLVRVTPLRIVFQDSELAKQGLGPILNGSREQRQDFFDAVAEAYCKAAGLLFVGDVFLTIASGTGYLALEVGGAEALSGEFVVGDLIPEIPPVSVGDVGTGAPPSAPPSSVPAPSPSGPSVPDGGDIGGDNGGTELGAAPAADLGPIERVCRSVHPFEWPSCSNGAAPLAGVLGLVATGAVFALDFRRNRLNGEAIPA